MIENIIVDCNGCSATYIIKHDLNSVRYEILHCSFCGGTDLELEDDYEEDSDPFAG